MTYQTPPVTMLGRWSRLRLGYKAALLTAAFLLPCCGVLTVIGALAGDPAAPGASSDDRAAAAGPLSADDSGAATEPAATEPAATEPAATGPASAPVAPPASAAPPKRTTTAARTERAATAPAAPVVVKRRVTEPKKIAFSTRRVDDASLDEGATEVRTEGVAGVRTLTWEITTTDGVRTGRRLIASRVTRKPVTKVVAVGTRAEQPAPGAGCDPNYGGCVPVASDVDCAGGSGNGPEYVTGSVEVTGDDIYDLDRDGDGYGCDD